MARHPGNPLRTIVVKDKYGNYRYINSIVRIEVAINKLVKNTQKRHVICDDKPVRKKSILDMRRENTSNLIADISKFEYYAQETSKYKACQKTKIMSNILEQCINALNSF